MPQLPPSRPSPHRSGAYPTGRVPVLRYARLSIDLKTACWCRRLPVTGAAEVADGTGAAPEPRRNSPVEEARSAYPSGRPAPAV